MTNDKFDLYSQWLASGLESNMSHDKSYPQESFSETIQESPAYQKEALVNGEPQPIVATRKDTKKCSITVIPGDTLHLGDLVKVFNEYWICVELYIDEFDMNYGELWMCNQVFSYQDFNLNTIHKFAIIDDGSYSKGSDKAIAVTDNNYNCYVSLDEESRALFIDKRLGISVICDKKGQDILDVGKIKWVDVKSRNFGEGSHLMVFGINTDPFNPDTDNINKMICDYKEKTQAKDHLNETDEGFIDEPMNRGSLVIDGKTTMRIGSCRTYTLTAVNKKSGEIMPLIEGIEWSVECDIKGVSITQNETTCRISVKEDDSLVGLLFTVGCVADGYEPAKLNVEVI